MAIIGKLLKKGTEISYRRNANNSKEYIKQLKTLKKLLFTSKNTEFGFFHSFNNILSRPDLVKSFQQQVPVMDYDAFYKQWLKKSLEGQANINWPGKIKYFALSSGTTGSPSKRIPVTEGMIRSFQKTSIRQLATLHEIDLPEAFFSSQFLTVGGSSRLTKKSNHIEGDLSGILKKHTSLLATPFTKPGYRISNIKDWNKKIDLIVQKAPKWNIGIIAGIPSWCILLMERIINHYNLNNIHDIWPNLQVYVHGGVFMGPYKEKLEKLCSKKVHLLDTYLASEGYFAYQTSSSSIGMKLLLDTGIFYEFIPFNSDYFDQHGQVINSKKALTLSQVKEGIDYALVITTNAGLWRYLIGDLVRFVNITERELIITGRIKQFLSLCGEHLSLENINEAIINLSKKEKIDIIEFTIFADEINQCHHWFISSNEPINSEVSEKMDKELCSLNDDYASARKYTLGAPKISVLNKSVFYGFLNSMGKQGGQNKFPRVLNKTQAKKWLKFIGTSKNSS